MALRNPFRKHKCPYCGYKFYPGECEIVTLQKAELIMVKQADGQWKRELRPKILPTSRQSNKLAPNAPVTLVDVSVPTASNAPGSQSSRVLTPSGVGQSLIDLEDVEETLATPAGSQPSGGVTSSGLGQPLIDLEDEQDTSTPFAGQITQALASADTRSASPTLEPKLSWFSPILLFLKRFFARLWVEPLDGEYYNRNRACRCCPNEYCLRALPYNFEYANSKVIAVVGNVFSGKSHYLAVCIRTLKTEEFKGVIGYESFVAIDDRLVGVRESTNDRFKKDYEEPLFDRGERLEATQKNKSSMREPLIFEMTFRKHGLRLQKHVNLLFYDASGEDIVNIDRLVGVSPYILNASALMFLVDPLSIPEIRESQGRDANLHSEVEAIKKQDSSQEVLSRMLQVLRRDRKGGDLKIPFAMVLSKADLLKYVNNRYKLDAHYLDVGTVKNKLDIDELEIIDKEVKTLLRHVQYGTLVDTVKYLCSSFFAVSATGSSPDKGKNTFSTVQPKHCMDPMLWVLWKLDIIKLS